METQKFRVFNRSRERFLSLKVTVVDTTSEPFKMLIEELAVHADIGLWLKPYRGIPAAPGLPPFYLVYLDKDYRVVQEVDSYPSPEVKPLNPRTASALVLPARTIFASQTLPGDQLEFSVADEAEEMERRRQVLSSRSGPGSVAQRKGQADILCRAWSPITGPAALQRHTTSGTSATRDFICSLKNALSLKPSF